MDHDRQEARLPQGVVCAVVSLILAVLLPEGLPNRAAFGQRSRRKATETRGADEDLDELTPRSFLWLARGRNAAERREQEPVDVQHAVEELAVTSNAPLEIP